MTDLTAFMGDVARAIWGEPNRQLCTKAELRWGTHGSRSVDLAKGVWHDHEAGEGGGVLDLIRRERGLSNGKAFEFLRELGLPLDPPANSARPASPRLVAAYDYTDENGKVLFQVCRFEPKTFRQRRPDGSWGVRGARLVPYRLPDLIDAVAHDRTVYVVEGEKDVDNLRALGVPATCNPMGAGKWPEDFARYFAGADVVILPDNDASGRKHRDVVAANLVASRSYRTGEEPFRSRYGALWLHELATATSSMAWIVKGVVPARSFGGIVGEPGCGKSFLSLDMAFTVGVLARLDALSGGWFGYRAHLPEHQRMAPSLVANSRAA